MGILGISVREESVPFVTSPIRLQAPLRRFTKKPDALVNCYAIFSNTSLFVAFPSNKWLLSACVVMRSLTSACSRRSRFTVVETSPVNERTFQSCSCNILVFTRETCTGKESFEQARISTYHFYIRHICAAINFHDLALERGRQSTCSSPEVCLQNAYRNLTRISRHFLETRGSPGKPGRLKDRERHGTYDKDEKFCKWNTNFHWDVPTGKTGLPSEQFHFFWGFSSRANRKNVFYLAPNRNFLNFWPNGKRPISSSSLVILNEFSLTVLFLFV